MSKRQDRLRKLMANQSNDEVKGDEAKEKMFEEDEQNAETYSQTDPESDPQPNPQTFAKIESEVPGAIQVMEELFPKKITLEKSRKRQTYWMDDTEIKMIAKMARKMKRKKYEVVASCIRQVYAEMFPETEK